MMEIGITVGGSIGRIDRTATGFPFVEVAVGEGDLRIEAVDEGRLVAALAGHDLLVHLPFPQPLGTTVREIDSATVAYQSRLLEWAGRHGARKAVLHATARRPDDRDCRDAARQVAAGIVEAGRDVGVEVCLENVGQLSGGLPLATVGEIADATGAGICLDVGHGHLEVGHDRMCEFAAGHDDLISHVHVHDVRARGDTHLPLGSGAVDLPAIADRLGDFHGTAAVEVFCDDVALLQDTAERTAAAFGVDRD